MENNLDAKMKHYRKMMQLAKENGEIETYYLIVYRVQHLQGVHKHQNVTVFPLPYRDAIKRQKKRELPESRCKPD